MDSKEEFIEKMKARTKQFVVDIVLFCNELPSTKSTYPIVNQLIRSASSTGANYRAACNARSQKEFFSKICIVVEEADESLYWLEIIEATELSHEKEKLKALYQEATEIAKIMGKQNTPFIINIKRKKLKI